MSRREDQPQAAPYKGRAGVAGRNRPARGVAQDVPFFTAARLERRAGALTETGIGYERMSGRAI
jgi:hypothetical protein